MSRSTAVCCCSSSPLWRRRRREPEEAWLLLVALGADDAWGAPTSSSSRWSAARLQNLVTVSHFPKIEQVRRFSTKKGCSTLQCTFRTTHYWRRSKSQRSRVKYDKIFGIIRLFSTASMPAPSPCPLLPQFWMIRIRFDRMDAKASSTFCGVARISDATWLWAQFVGYEKSSWQSDTAATGLKALSFHLLASSSNTVGGLTSGEFRASSSRRVLASARRRKRSWQHPLWSTKSRNAYMIRTSPRMPTSLTCFFIPPFLLCTQNDWFYSAYLIL